MAVPKAGETTNITENSTATLKLQLDTLLAEAQKMAEQIGSHIKVVKASKGRNPNPKPCIYCGEPFGTRKMRLHVTVCPSRDKLRNFERFPCPYCKEEFASNRLNVHISKCPKKPAKKTAKKRK